MLLDSTEYNGDASHARLAVASGGRSNCLSGIAYSVSGCYSIRTSREYTPLRSTWDLSLRS